MSGTGAPARAFVFKKNTSKCLGYAQLEEIVLLLIIDHSSQHIDALLQRNAQVPLCFQFYEGDLMVGVTKYCKLQ